MPLTLRKANIETQPLPEAEVQLDMQLWSEYTSSLKHKINKEQQEFSLNGQEL